MSKPSPEVLWAPWRLEYIENTTQDQGCIFCEKPNESADRDNLLVKRGSHVFIIMNKYPYNNGHLLIVPYRHTAELGDLKQEETLELFRFIQEAQDGLRELMKPQGFNIGMNVGRLAGAGIADHLHFHVVPRWGGDTNFMPVIGKTKVISEALEQTWDKLKDYFDNHK
ncbi:HIT family hydrolase [bacterium I07]|nr:HIT family hydrolase [bacterium I07]